MLPHSILTPQTRSLGLARPHLLAPASRPLRCVVVAGKKKGGGGGGGGGGNKKKGAGIPQAAPKVARPYLTAPVIMQNLLLIESHFRKTGRPLFTEELDISEVAEALWEAPFPVLSHDTGETEAENPAPTGPVFVYANQAALDLFEAEWDELIGTPSAKSAEPIDDIQQDRSSILSKVLENGAVDNYQGKRISFKGTKFNILKATLFNVEAPSGDMVGQAAVIKSWEFEDGRKGGEAAVEEEAAAAAAEAAERAAVGVSPEEIAAAEAAVTEQAQVVRELKEVKGLANSSEEVEAAVAVLLEKKAALAALKTS
ncbi:hypothetical protein Ndes2437B_g06964 [Nannochloris sp. 'desiccata']